MYVSVGIVCICRYFALCVHYVQKTASTAAHTGYLSVSDNCLSVFPVWGLYVQAYLVGHARKDSGSPSEASWHRIGFIPIHFSSGKGRVVIGPDHGPRVDVEQGTARAWLALTIAHATFIARVFQEGFKRQMSYFNAPVSGPLLAIFSVKLSSGRLLLVKYRDHANHNPAPRFREHFIMNTAQIFRVFTAMRSTELIMW